MEVELPELLFFDTFSHDTYEQNLDLVQFPKPVYITEVRIIPLGARVHADFPGGVRLGATNPSNFHIQLYVNDLGKPGAPIFESLGELEYNQNNCIHLQCSGGATGTSDEFVRRIPTDGLVLKGWYTTMTLAVYGILTTSIAEPIVSPRETTPQPNEQLLVVPDHHHHQHLLHHHHHLHHHGGSGGGIAEPSCGGGDWIQEPPLPGLVTTHPSETVFVQKEYPEDDSEDAPKDPRPYARRAAAAAAAVITHPMPASAASPPEPIYEPLEAGKILPGECEPPLPEKRSKACLPSGRPVEPAVPPYPYERSPRTRRHSSREEFSSRSPSLCKDYGPMSASGSGSVGAGGASGGSKQREQWSRSPDYGEQQTAAPPLSHPPLPPPTSSSSSSSVAHRSSRRLRSGSFERPRREPSFERMEKEDRRPRPRSPIDSPRRPRSPDRNESSPDEEEDVVDDVEDVDDDLDDDIEMDGSFHRTNGKYSGKRSMLMMEPAIDTIRPQSTKQHASSSRSSSQHQHQHHQHQHAQHHYHHGHTHQHHSSVHQLPSHNHHQQQQQQQDRVMSPPPPQVHVPSVCDTVSSALTPVASPTTMLIAPAANLPDEDAISVTEQFEPILSDEEIPEDFDYEQDGAAAVTGGPPSGGYEHVDEALNKQFDPFSITLERYVHPGSIGDEPDLVRQLGHGEQKLMRQLEQLLGQGRYGRDATASFEQESAEWKERFVDYAEQLVHVLGQLLGKDDVRDALQQQLERWIKAEWAGVTDRLANCICVGLDFERAMVQPQPAFKLRHMKSGIRLAEFLGPHEQFIGLLLHTPDHFNLFDRLLGLYSQPHMALSIKLMIIRTIYACLDTRNAVHYFLSPSYNGYQILLDLLQENPSTRISFALKSLLRKISLYENLELIHSTVEELYVRAGEGEQEVQAKERQIRSDQELLELLRSALTELTTAISLHEVSLAQPKRFLPVSAKFEIHKDIASSLNVSRTVVQFFKIHRLVESMVLLLDLRITPPALCELVYNLLACMLKSMPKLHYLVDSLPYTNLLLRWLFHRLPPALNGGCGDSPVQLLVMSEEMSIGELSRPQLLGVELVYKAQTIYHLEAIASTSVVRGGDVSSTSRNADEIERERDRLVENLHDLYELSCGPGRRFVVEVLSMDDNLAVLLELVEKEQRVVPKEDGSGSMLTAPATKHKSPIVGYCVDLVDCTVRHGEAVGYLAQHGPALLSLVKQHEQFEPGMSATLQELAVYLKPLELHDLFAYIDIGPLVELMRRSLEYVTAFPGDLITALRLVRLLGIPPYDDYEQPGGHAEFKYKYTLLQFYSADGQALLLAILDKLTHHFDQPAIHTSSLASQQGVLLTQLLCPLVYILRKLVTYLIECRNTEFRDLTLIEPLLRTYTLMQCVPIHAAAGPDARQVQREVVRILLAYTQPTPPEGLDTNNVHRSLWTQMVGELVRFTLAGPNYFLPGLLVLSELLPLPLPIHCRQPLLPAELSRLIQERQLWSAHLHPQSPAIGELIQTLCTSSYTPMLAVLSRVCLQLSDLAPNMTLLISKSLADLIVQEQLLPCGLASTSHARLVSFLATLVCHASVKISVLSILPGRIMDMLMGVLLNPGQTPAHQQTQQHIYLTFQSLFDAEIALMFGDTIDPALQLACSLPPKDIIESFCAACTVNVTCADIGLGVLMAGLRTMLLLTEHDTTYVILMSNIMRKREGWCAVLHKFLRKAKESSETYRALFALLCDFWRSLVTFDNDGCVNLPKRTVKLPLEQLGQLMPLYEEGDEDALQLMLSCLEELMALFKGEEIADSKKPPTELNDSTAAMDTAVPAQTRATDSLCDNLTYLHTQVKMEITSAKLAQGKAAVTPIDWSVVSVDPLPQAEGIVTQYGSRSVYLLSEDCDEQLKATDWFGFTPCDDDLEREQIPCDLQDLAKVCLAGETNLTADCKRLLHLSASPHSNRDRLTTAPCFRTRRVEVEPSTGRPEKKIFATPLRGRGFSRTPTTRGDLFRSRPPNTSRPPSLHVDDFLALETCGAQPTGPTGYNKLSRDIITIRGTNRSRGRFPDRGARSGGGGGGAGGGNSNGSGGSGGNGGHWQSAPSGNSGGNSGGVGGGMGGGSSCWSSSGSSQMHDGGGGNGPGSGKHFGHGLSGSGGGVGPGGTGGSSGGGGGGSSGHYRDPPSHFGGSQRSRSGRGFNRYSVRAYARQI
ncbi:protein virilizer [Anopheles marshallii]|uniref:protein virilizer n=1 Tax=Anopheles marshallii TaxID=1521116 RepID=UPI00237A399B|nr:protein virilizer [Anopheles marshallii]